MAVSEIEGRQLEITVVAGNKLKDTEWISRQDPYVWLAYGTQKFRTKTCIDGGINPSFQEKFTVTLTEGLREIMVDVWNSNIIKSDDFIGSGKIELNAVLSKGYDDSLWSLQRKSGRHAGEVRLIMHYTGAKAIVIPPQPNSSPACPSTPDLLPPQIRVNPGSSGRINTKIWVQ
ncbi:hypothetical protein ACHQM5_030227 [Ranunculus cassubicifolius]